MTPFGKLPPLPPPTKDLKHRVICAGVEQLIRDKGLDPAKVVVWCDWQSIYQVTGCTVLVSE